MEISRSIVFLEGVMPTAFLTSMVLAAEERTALERWTRRATTAQALAFRARVILACAGGANNTMVARQLRVTRATVGKWRALSPPPARRAAR